MWDSSGEITERNTALIKTTTNSARLSMMSRRDEDDTLSPTRDANNVFRKYYSRSPRTSLSDHDEDFSLRSRTVTAPAERQSTPCVSTIILILLHLDVGILLLLGTLLLIRTLLLLGSHDHS